MEQGILFENDNNQSEKIEIPLHHVQQQFNWDCGLACVLMILSDDQRQHFVEHFQEICAEEGFKTSVWTIDLAYLLKRFSIEHVYCTLTLGVDPGYSDDHYYTHVVPMDEGRVVKRFQSSSDNELIIEQRHVDLKDVLVHLQAGNVCIALVNSNLLECFDCKTPLLQSAMCRMFPANCFKTEVSYNGHFIVLCGYDLKTKRILYRNPSYHERICSTSFEAFEATRCSYGTDEDIIFIKKSQVKGFS